MNGMRFVSVLAGPAVSSLLRHLPDIFKFGTRLLELSILTGISYNVYRTYEATARMLAIAEEVFGAVQSGPPDEDDDIVQFWLDEHAN